MRSETYRSAPESCRQTSARRTATPHPASPAEAVSGVTAKPACVRFADLGVSSAFFDPESGEDWVKVDAQCAALMADEGGTDIFPSDCMVEVWPRAAGGRAHTV